jgi:tRNA (guanine9-N1)-methyltransferase
MDEHEKEKNNVMTNPDEATNTVSVVTKQPQQDQEQQQQQISKNQRGQEEILVTLVDDLSKRDENQLVVGNEVATPADVNTSLNDNPAADATTNTSGEIQPLSKKQMKKRKRYEKLMDIKKRKKQQAKERRHSKAAAEGRDLEEERRLQLEREKSGEGRKRREEEWNKKMESAKTSFCVCIDCGFEDLMTFKEVNSLASQIRYCYAANKRSENPVYISLSSLNESGTTFEQLSKVEGFPERWKSRGFSCSCESLETMHDIKNLVYLTSDSETTLEHLDDSKIYVIGGIVDRNRLKGITIEKANELGIETAKLPIEEHLKLVATKVLTVNHVFEILLKYRELGNDWKRALLEVLPQRKDITEIE